MHQKVSYHFYEYVSTDRFKRAALILREYYDHANHEINANIMSYS